MAATPAYLEFLLEHLAVLGTITQRRMFGGHCLYCDGTVFALLAGNTLYLKADADSRQAFLERRLEQFRPFEDATGAHRAASSVVRGKSTSMNYFQPPPEFFEDPDALLHWGRMAVAAGQRGAKPRKRAAKKKAPAL